MPVPQPPTDRRTSGADLAWRRARTLAVSLLVGAAAVGVCTAPPPPAQDLGGVQRVADAGAPATPTSVTVTPGDTTLTVSWAAVASASGYTVYVDGTARPMVTSTSTTLTGLTNGRSYSITVTALGPSFFFSRPESDPSAPITRAPADSKPPAAPGQLAASSADRSSVLTWAAPADKDVVGYEVLNASGAVVASTSTARTVTVTGLVNGVVTTLRVRAVDSSGNRGATASVTVTPRDSVAPGAPTGLTATPGDRSATLSWTAPTDTDLDHYEVRTTDGTLVATVPAPTTTVTLQNLTNGTSYSGRVTAFDTSGHASPASATVTVVPRSDLVAGAPTRLTASGADRSAVLSWTAPGDTDLASYVVVDASGTTVATVPASTTTATITGLTNGSSHTYRVKSVDTSGNSSPFTAAVTVVPRDAVAPGAPANLAASGADRSALLSWTAPPDTDLQSYAVLDESGATVATVPAGTTSATVAGLTNGSSHAYRLQALDTSGNASPLTAAVTVVPRDGVAPDAPTHLTGTGADRAAVLSWTAPAATDLASVVVVDANGAAVATVPSGTTSVTITGLSNGSSYAYRVQSVDTSGNSSALSAAVTVVPRDAAAPTAPADLAATPADRSAVLSWTAPAGGDVASYVVVDASGATVATVPSGTTSATITGLTNGSSYAYRVRAVDTSGNSSPFSSAATVVPRDASAPAVPTDLSATGGDRFAAVAWTAPGDVDVASYVVVDASGATVATVPSGTTSATITGLTNGSSYTYRVRAVDTSGNSSASSTAVTVVPHDSAAPQAPADLTAAAGEGAATLRWVAPAATDLASYVVVDASGATVATVPAGTTSATITGLTNGSSYTYRVRAVDTSGNSSPFTAAVTVVPADVTPPAAPSDVSGTAGDGSATLTWSPVPDADHYLVLDDGGTVVATSPAGTTTATVPGLVDGTPATFRVAAVDAAGNRSTPSDPVVVTPVAAPVVTPVDVPAGLRATPGDGQAGLSWTPVAGATSYVLVRDGSVVTTVTGSPTVVTGLTNGVAVSFTVAAVVGGRTSAASAAVSVTPVQPTAPVAAGSGGTSGLAGTRDGRFVVVGTKARLEASDTNAAYELYLVDRALGSARRIAPLPSSWSASTSDGANSGTVALSADGRYAVLVTNAAKVPGDLNTLNDVYRVDLSTGAWQLVSVPAGGSSSRTVAGTVLQTGSSVYATGPSVAVSADGDRVAFYSDRTDLVAGDTNGVTDVFVKDLASGAVTRVSTTSTGASTGRTATGPALAMTPDGRYVVYTATSSSGPVVAFRKDLTTGELRAVSTAGSGSAVTELGVNRDVDDVSVSDDGRYVGFSSPNKALTTTPAATWGAALAYRKDVTTGALSALGSGQTGTWEHGVQLDPTGAYGFFQTIAAEVSADVDGHTDVYRGSGSGAPVLVTSRADGTPSPTVVTGSVLPSEYATVRVLSGGAVLVSTLQALVDGDVNRVADVYRRDLDAGVASPVLPG